MVYTLPHSFVNMHICECFEPWAYEKEYQARGGGGDDGWFCFWVGPNPAVFILWLEYVLSHLNEQLFFWRVWKTECRPEILFSPRSPSEPTAHSQTRDHKAACSTGAELHQ